MITERIDRLAYCADRLSQAIREQDHAAATKLLAEFRVLFDERRETLAGDPAAIEFLTSQSLELMKHALKVCSIHRQMLAERMRGVSASTGYVGTAETSSSTWQTDL